MLLYEAIEIKCPQCRKVHRYELEVRRSRVMQRVSLSGGGPSTIEFSRLFTCPVKGEDFEATFSLVSESSFRVEGVKVKGVVPNAKQK